MRSILEAQLQAQFLLKYMYSQVSHSVEMFCCGGSSYCVSVGLFIKACTTNSPTCHPNVKSDCCCRLSAHTDTPGWHKVAGVMCLLKL